MAEAQEANHSINFHFDKQGTIRISVDVPGLKVKGFATKKVDEKTCELSVNLDDDRVQLNARLLSGTNQGKTYQLSLDKDDLNIHRIMPQPRSSYKVKNDVVEIFVKKN